mmetsp:Transcript_7803/g.16922  ORF Transcript_7803/g.16922 Transcript_7803/m.16922 type:complete len:409 (+) Transcript_7803:110-1336(+)
MNRFVVCALLMGLIGTQGLELGMQTQNMGKYPEHAREGCVPWQQDTPSCPPRLECFADDNYVNGGRCDCNPIWWRVLGKLSFDDNEFDDGFSAEDCVSLVIPAIVVVLQYLFCLALAGSAFHTTIVVIRELWRSKALKWNASSYSLFYMVWASAAVVAFLLIQIFNVVGLDKKEFWFKHRSYLFAYGIIPPNGIIDYEIGVTWIDLYDRTNKMSKSSSKSLKILRYFLRFIAFGQTIVFAILQGQSSLLATYISALAPSVTGGLFIAVGGKIILKTICPDKKDVSNPNFKVAQAIRRAVQQNIVCRFLEFVALMGWGITMRNAVLTPIYCSVTTMYYTAYMIRLWGWLQYLIFGSRKHLKKYANNASSAYFGFSTIGLNKTLTTASSMVSSRSSAISSRSSAAPDEKD